MFTVFPVAFREFTHWLYQWQVLAAAFLVLAAAHIWGRAILRATRATTANHGGTRRRSKSPVFAVKADPHDADPVAETASSGSAAPGSDLMDRLGILRRLIRMTLGDLPCTDEVLTAESLAFCCQIARFAVDTAVLGEHADLLQRYETLRMELDRLGALGEADTCRSAWETLVRISNAARDLINAAAEPGGGKDTVDWDSFAVRSASAGTE